MDRVITNIDELKKVSESVSLDEGKEISHSLLSAIVERKLDNEIGLAAPQIGIFKRVFITYNLEEQRWITWINPVILSKSQQIVMSKEGCLSAPDLKFVVNRHREIEVNASNLSGPKKLFNFEAIVFQHELDHLNGILISDIGRRVKG